MSSNEKMQQWFAQLSPRTTASRRFIEFCKADVGIQCQQENFNPHIYCESVLSILKHLEHRSKVGLESEEVNTKMIAVRNPPNSISSSAKKTHISIEDKA